jgi:uncharacterized protein
MAAKVFELYHIASQKPFDDANFLLSREHFDLLDIDEYKKLFIMCSESKSPAALILLGRLYHNGFSVPKDITKAFEYFTQAVNMDDECAMYALGVWYKENKNIPKAIEYLTRCAKIGNTTAIAKLAQIDRSWEPELTKYAEWNPHAMYNLGELYRIGEVKDPAKVIYWQTKAADLGRVNALHNLGTYYRDAYGVPQDDTKAAEFFQKAADLNFPSSINNLGLCYLNKDKSKALELFQKAARMGYPLAKYNLAIHLETEDPAIITKLFTEIIDSSHAHATYLVAECYNHGQHVPQDKQKALELYHKAAELGSKDAMYNLGELYRIGEVKDPSKVIYWHTKAADLGHAHALGNLGTYYRDAYGVPQDDAKAAELFQKAADQDSLPAIYNLGICYLYGCGIPENKSKATELFKKASDMGFVLSKYSVAIQFADQAERTKLFTEIAASNDKYTIYLSANYYHGPTYVPQDAKNSFELYQKAADLNHPAAIGRLGNFYRHGWHVPADPNKALELYTKASELGNAWSVYMLGEMQDDPLTAINYCYKAFSMTEEWLVKTKCTEKIRELITAEMFTEFASLKKDFKELQSQNEQLTIEVRFRPGGVGCMKAMENYKKKLNSKNYVKQSLGSKKTTTKVQRRYSWS